MQFSGSPHEAATQKPQELLTSCHVERKKASHTPGISLHDPIVLSFLAMLMLRRCSLLHDHETNALSSFADIVSLCAGISLYGTGLPILNSMLH